MEQRPEPSQTNFRVKTLFLVLFFTLLSSVYCFDLQLFGIFLCSSKRNDPSLTHACMTDIQISQRSPVPAHKLHTHANKKKKKPRFSSGENTPFIYINIKNTSPA